MFPMKDSALVKEAVGMVALVVAQNCYTHQHCLLLKGYYTTIKIQPNAF